MDKKIPNLPAGQMISTWRMSQEGLSLGNQILKEKNDLGEAIVRAVKCVEDNPAYVSVGYGGLPNREGQVELDAAYMDGDTLGTGAVISVKNLKNPIEAAYRLSKKKTNSILAGDGAMKYASYEGLPCRNMLTESSRTRYEEEKKEQMKEEERRAYEGHDTVCIIGRSREGSMACGVSTSGLYMKEPGRVGDSPFIGSGFYADSEAGAAAATGMGEDIMKGCLSFASVEKIRNGLPVQEACEKALEEHWRRLERRGYTNRGMSVIAMDNQGNAGAATTLDEFPFVVAGKDGCRLYVASMDQETGEHFLFAPDEEWLKNSKSD